MVSTRQVVLIAPMSMFRRVVTAWWFGSGALGVCRLAWTLLVRVVHSRLHSGAPRLVLNLTTIASYIGFTKNPKIEYPPRVRN